MKQKFSVTGMTCSACQAHVEKAVRHTEGVQDVQVNLLSNSMVVTYDQAAVSPETIIAAVQKAGYGAALPGQTEAKPQDGTAEQLKEMKRRLIVSFVFLIPLMYISMGHMMGLPLPGFFHGVANAVSLGLDAASADAADRICQPEILPGGFQDAVARRAQYGFADCHRLRGGDRLRRVRHFAHRLWPGAWAIWTLVHQYAMDLYFESAAMILTLITLGKYLETRSKGKTSEAIRKLMDLAPKTAMVVREAGRVEIPLEQVAVGDTVVVRPGAQRAGGRRGGQRASPRSTESALTGESIPVEKGAGRYGARRHCQPDGRACVPGPEGGRRHHAFADHRPGGGGRQFQSADCQAGRQDQRRICAGGHLHRGHRGGRMADAGAIRLTLRCPRHCGAGHLLPVRAGAGHAGGHHGGHRQRGRVRRID